jgi:hypothetical protein
MIVTVLSSKASALATVDAIGRVGSRNESNIVSDVPHDELLTAACLTTGADASADLMIQVTYT